MIFNISSMSERERFALFYGIMLGDGCLSHYFCNDGRERFVICITGHGSDDLEFYEEILSPLLRSFGRKSVSIKKRKDCNCIEINFPDKVLFDKIHSYEFPIGKKGTKIYIPEFFYKNNLVNYVVAGFMATDGSLVLTKNPNKYYPRVEGNGISSRLIKQISDYLNTLGMKGSFYKSKRKNNHSKIIPKHQPYRFQFNGMNNLLLFNEKIGFLNPKHQKKFLNFLRYNGEYDVNINGIPSQQQRLIRDRVKL